MINKGANPFTYVLLDFMIPINFQTGIFRSQNYQTFQRKNQFISQSDHPLSILRTKIIFLIPGCIELAFSESSTLSLVKGLQEQFSAVIGSEKGQHSKLWRLGPRFLKNSPETVSNNSMRKSLSEMTTIQLTEGSKIIEFYGHYR